MSGPEFNETELKFLKRQIERLHELFVQGVKGMPYTQHTVPKLVLKDFPQLIAGQVYEGFLAGIIDKLTAVLGDSSLDTGTPIADVPLLLGAASDIMTDSSMPWNHHGEFGYWFQLSSNSIAVYEPMNNVWKVSADLYITVQYLQSEAKKK